jgi:hypothetical protein
MNVRNASRALIGTDATPTRPSPLAPTPLVGLPEQAGRAEQQVALDDGLVEADRFTWQRLVNIDHQRSNLGMSLVRVNS